MKQLFVVVALVSSISFAQEIGTEIEPTTPPPTPAAQPSTYHSPAPVEETQLSAGKGSFGIRGGFVASNAFAPPATGTATPVGFSNLGVSLFLGDSAKLLVDVGFGLGLTGSNASFGFGVGAGIEILFRKTTDALRPLVHISAQFGGAGTFNTIAVGLRAGFGAEYFFTKNFSVNALLAVDLPFYLGSAVAFRVATAAPGLGATLYF